MKKEILFITGNKNKLEEVRVITSLNIISKKLEIQEIQALNVEKVAKAKALSAFKQTNQPVIVDDTSLSIETLGGLPGAFVSWFLDTIKPEGIADLISGKKNRRASVSTCIAYADETGVYTFTGTINGRISESPRGKNGFGYDPIFIPDGHGKTYAEMNSDEKNEISMRKIALIKFKKFVSTL